MIFLVKDENGNTVYRYEASEQLAFGCPWGGFDQVEEDAEITAAIQLADAKQGVKAMRNYLLQQSDYMMLPDVACDKQAATIYRQALRDLPENIDPLNPIWPEKP